MILGLFGNSKRLFRPNQHSAIQEKEVQRAERISKGMEKSQSKIRIKVEQVICSNQEI